MSARSLTWIAAVVCASAACTEGAGTPGASPTPAPAAAAGEPEPAPELTLADIPEYLREHPFVGLAGKHVLPESGHRPERPDVVFTEARFFHVESPPLELVAFSFEHQSDALAATEALVSWATTLGGWTGVRTTVNGPWLLVVGVAKGAQPDSPAKAAITDLLQGFAGEE